MSLCFKSGIFIFLILIISLSANATTIDIYYPNDNITTDIYYSIGNEYIYTQNNTLYTEDDLTCIIIKNQYVSNDIITSPTKILAYAPLLFYTIILIMIVLLLVGIAKKMVR